jgi:alpha-tubulin suppressor-like RCC1 family protein
MWPVVPGTLPWSHEMVRPSIILLANSSTGCLVYFLARTLHSVLTGGVFTFGDGTGGQLGHDDQTSQLCPQVVVGCNDVFAVAAACGNEHTILVTAAGTLFSWGEGKCGALGHGDRRAWFKPMRVQSLDASDTVVTCVACGPEYSAAASDHGTLFTGGR